VSEGFTRPTFESLPCGRTSFKCDALRREQANLLVFVLREVNSNDPRDSACQSSF